MVVVAQLVRASDCDSEGRRFEPGHPPKTPVNLNSGVFFIADIPHLSGLFHLPGCLTKHY
jgi:hypothetical protein